MFMYCPNCGTANEGSVRFCANCGTSLTSAGANPNPQPPPQQPIQPEVVPPYAPAAPPQTRDVFLKYLGMGCLILIAILFLEDFPAPGRVSLAAADCVTAATKG